MARLESLKNLNQNLQKEKLETESLSFKLKSELKLSLSQQNQLLRTIQKLENEVYETYLDGFSALFEDDAVEASETKEIVPNLT